MHPPGLGEPVREAVHVRHRKTAQSGGKGILPVVVRYSQGALKIDPAPRALVDLREAEVELIIE